MAARVLDVGPSSTSRDARSLRPGPVGGRPATDHAPAQFARFVLVGASASLVYAGLFLMLAGLGTQAANAVAVVASTALANELHRRLTFRAGDRVGWMTAQWAGGGLALAGLAASSLTLAALEVGTGPSEPLVSVIAVWAVNGAVGLARFVVLRWLLAVRPVPA